MSDEAGASLSQSFGMDKADIFFGRTLKLTLGWKIRSHRSENGKKIMGEDPQSLQNHGFPQISQLVLHSRKRQLSIWTAVFLIIQRKLHRKHTPLRQRVTCRTPPAPGACAPSPARRRDSAAHSFRRKYTRRRDAPAKHSVPAPSPAVFPVLWPN